MPAVPLIIEAAKQIKTKDAALAFVVSPDWDKIQDRRAELTHAVNHPGTATEPVDDRELAELNKQSRRIMYLAYPAPTDPAMVEMMLRYGEGKGIR